MLLTNAIIDSSAQPIDLRIVDGIITEIGEALSPHTGEMTTALDGWFVVPAACEPHAHLDKAYLAERVPNPTGDLMGAINAMQTHRHLISHDDIVTRAERAVRRMAANGVTAIRSHADVTSANGLQSVVALREVRDRLRDLVDLQIAALIGWPILGEAGADNRALARDAIQVGVDVIGGCPHLETNPDAATDYLLELAESHACALDLHTDETLNPDALAVEHLARRVIATGFTGLVTASHCVSLSVQPTDVQARVADALAAADVNVIVLPHTNLFLQGRDQPRAMPRGVAPVHLLSAAGVNVAAGADNVQDPFNPVGRADPAETAALLTMTSHTLPDDSWRRVSTNARRAIGLADNSLRVGATADVMAVRVGSIRELIATAPSERRTMRGGVWRELAPS